MRNFLLTICIITFLYSCSSDEKPYIEQWMQDIIGTEEVGTIGNIHWNDSTFYSMTGIKDKKLRIGFFKDKNYSDPIFVWTAPEPFPVSCKFNYGDYNIKPHSASLNADDQNNFSGIITCIGMPNTPDKENVQGNAEVIYYAFFVMEGKYKLINKPLTVDETILYSPIRWYDKSVAIYNILYTKDGEEIPIRTLPQSTLPINLFEGIYSAIHTIKRINIQTGESVWEVQINEDIDSKEQNPPILSQKTINRNGNKW